MLLGTVFVTRSPQVAAPPGSGADGNANGTIDAQDYTFWRSHFGNPAGSGAVSGAACATPEPTVYARTALQEARSKALAVLSLLASAKRLSRLLAVVSANCAVQFGR